MVDQNYKYSYEHSFTATTVLDTVSSCWSSIITGGIGTSTISMSNDNSSCSSMFYGGSVVCAGIVAIYAYRYFWITNKNDTGTGTKIKVQVRTVEYAKGFGMFETIRRFGGNQSPLFLVEMSRKVYKEQNGMTSFRLPLPIKNGSYLVADPKLAIQILKDSTTDKNRLYKTLNIVLGTNESIFTSTNNYHWKSIRKATAHAFSTTEISRMRDVVQRHAVQWCENKKLSNTNSNGTSTDTKSNSIIIDPTVEMVQLTFNIICEAAFEYIATHDDFYNFTTNTQLALRELFIKNAVTPYRSKYGYYVSSEYRKAYRASKKLQQLAQKILDAYENNPNKSKQNTVIKAIASMPNFTPAEKVAETLVFLVAGHDTSGLSIANTLCLLAQNLIVAKTLYEHATEQNLLKNPELWSKQLQYFTCIVKETHRFFPVAPLGSGRIIGKDFVVSTSTTSTTTAPSTSKNSNHDQVQEEIIQTILPKGCNVSLPQIVFTRCEQIFPNADVFIPERWLPSAPSPNSSNDVDSGADDDLRNLALMPFSTGSRNCVGQALATIEIDTVLPIILSSFNVQLQERGYEDYFSTWRFTNSRLLLVEH